MPKIRIELSVAQEAEWDYRSRDYSAEQVERITSNLENDRVWGWCRPEVKAVFPGITLPETVIGTATLVGGSFASEEEFRNSKYYKHFLKEAVGEVKLKIYRVKELFDQAVEALNRDQPNLER